MTIIVDASVALKWVIEEGGSDAAGGLLLQEPLAAPDLLMIECANVLWTKARRGALTRDLARAALVAIQAAPVELLPASGYVAAAHDSLRPRSDGLRQPLPRCSLGRTDYPDHR